MNLRKVATLLYCGRMKFYFLIFVLFLQINLCAQDPQFMMYTDNPGIQNPALVGANHALRASVTYKDQWRNVSLPYKSFGMNMDMRFKPDNWQQASRLKIELTSS